MGPPALVDTNLLIDFLAGRREAHRELARYTDRAVSIISRIELLAGVDGEERARAEAFLRLFTQIELTSAIAEQAIQVRRTTRLKMPDAILLGTAQVEARVLLTRNTRDFSPGKFVRVPYEI